MHIRVTKFYKISDHSRVRNWQWRRQWHRGIIKKKFLKFFFFFMMMPRCHYRRRRCQFTGLMKFGNSNMQMRLMLKNVYHPPSLPPTKLWKFHKPKFGGKKNLKRNLKKIVFKKKFKKKFLSSKWCHCRQRRLCLFLILTWSLLM